MAIQTNTRAAGVLLPVFSLPSPYGIGCFSKEARTFIDRLADAQQQYWQILPIGPVGGFNSPYQPRSCFAGEPLYIDPETLAAKGLLTEEELSAAAEWDFAVSRVDYHRVFPARIRLLRAAYGRFQEQNLTESTPFRDFCREHADWLPDYALFEALSAHFDTNAWYEWPEPIRLREPSALRYWQEELADEIVYQMWMQFEFSVEWDNLKDYAHSRGIRIIGDIPIYTSLECSDVWTNRRFFQLGEDCLPDRVSGAPPDAFSPAGQIWGNPLYDWDLMKKDGYTWWIRRLAHMFKLYDVVRLDHTRGFESYFSIPADAEDAGLGHWEKGPGIGFFNAVYQALGSLDLIAEDLGDITPEVIKMVKDAGLPGMKILQFAFDSDSRNPYLIENFGPNSVVYTGTHDNDTTIGWYSSLPASKKGTVTSYLRSHNGIYDSARAPLFSAVSASSLLIELAYRSDAAVCIIPLQDHLQMDSSGRINVPGTVSQNWEWRLEPNAFSRTKASHMAELVRRYGR